LSEANNKASSTRTNGLIKQGREDSPFAAPHQPRKSAAARSS